MTSPHDAEYWLKEIEETETKLANLMKDTSSDIKSSKSDTDSITFHGIEERINAYKKYIGFCKGKYQECVDKERPKSILYFAREYGY